MNLSVGPKLGGHEVRSKIGEGGMGEVYLVLLNDDRRLDPLHLDTRFKICRGASA